MKAALSLIILVVSAAYGQPMRFSLEEATQFALEHSVEAMNAELQVEAAQSTVAEVTRLGLPQVHGEISYLNYLELPTSLIPAEFLGGPPGEFAELQFGTRHNLNASVTATQLIFDGAFLVGVKAAGLFVELQRRERERKEIDVRAAVTKAYYGVLVASRNLALLRESHALLRQLHHETNELYKAGFVEAIEVDRLTLSLTSLEAQISAVERLAALSESLLKFQMGMDFSAEIELTDSLGSLTSAAPELLIAGDDSFQRIELDILDIQRALAEANVKRYRSAHLPSVGAFANFNYSAQRSEFNFLDTDQSWFPMSSIGVAVRIPLWDSFSKSASVQKEKTNLEIIMNYRVLLAQGIRLEVEQTRTAYENASEQEKTLKANLELAQKILRIATIKYQEGVGSSLEVSTSQSTVLQTQSAYINALYELLIAKTDLEKALGLL